MPTLESIRRFEKALVSLGSEPDVLAERGEEIEDVVPPDQAFSPDLHDLLTAPGAGRGQDAEDEPSDEAAQAPAGELEEPQEPAGAESLDALDLEAFGLSDAAVEEPATQSAGDRPPSEEVGALEIPAEAASFEAPEAPETPEALETPPVTPESAPATEAPADEAEEFNLPEGLFETPQEGRQAGAEDEAFDLSGLELPELDEPSGIGAASGQAAGELPLPDDLFEQPPAEGEPAAEPGRAPEAGEAIELPADLADEAGPDLSALDLPDLAEIAFDEGEPPKAQQPEPAAAAAPAPQAPPPPEPGAPEQPDEEDFVIDQFALPGAEAAELEQTPEFAPAEPAAPEAAQPEAAYEAEGAKAEYTDEEFQALREALAGLPLSLRVAVEEQIGARKITGQPLGRLLDLLIEGASAAEVARALEKATGIRVSVARGAEKGTGIAFERERGTLGFILRTVVLPRLRILVPVAGLLAGLVIAANEYIVKPVEAWRTYKRAVSQVEAGQYEAAAQTFNDATSAHAMVGWFHRTAEAYRERREYARAADLYERLLGGRTLLGADPKLAAEADRRWDIRTRRRLRLTSFDKRAVLAYAGMRTNETFEYAAAETLLQGYLAQTGMQGDYEALLALGDNYIEWGVEQREKYEEAARAYRKAMGAQKRPTDEPVLRMLRYYARTGDTEQVRRLVLGFEATGRGRVDAPIYAEAAGALVDGGVYDVARQALDRAYKTSRTTPEIYYQYSRYFRWAGDTGAEESALGAAIAQYQAVEQGGRSTARERRLELLAINALGELYYRRGEPLKAQAEYGRAISMLEARIGDKRLRATPDLGRIYANSGDVHYYHERELSGALAMYEKARAMGLGGEDLAYKIGYIHYDRALAPGAGAAVSSSELQRALGELHAVAQTQRDNPSALYALANTLYLRGDYFAAQGYYTRLLKQMEARRQRVPQTSPQEDSAMRRLLELTMRTYNNLGVNEKKLSQDTRSPNRESRALYYLSRSIEFHDQMMRDPETMARSESRNLGFLNSRAIMYPQAGIELEIYRELPLDLQGYGL